MHIRHAPKYTIIGHVPLAVGWLRTGFTYLLASSQQSGFRLFGLVWAQHWRKLYSPQPAEFSEYHRAKQRKYLAFDIGLLRFSCRRRKRRIVSRHSSIPHFALKATCPEQCALLGRRALTGSNVSAWNFGRLTRTHITHTHHPPKTTYVTNMAWPAAEHPARAHCARVKRAAEQQTTTMAVAATESATVACTLTIMWLYIYVQGVSKLEDNPL